MKKIEKEFLEFIAKGNVIDLAVGVIIGGAFGQIVTSLVNNILMPLIGILVGGHDFSSMAFRVGNATVMYGLFIQSIVNFLIIAISIFFFVKVINKVKGLHKKDKPKEADKPDELSLLTEIRDLLKKKK
jgi:large conductance mechanosensitive channel